MLVSLKKHPIIQDRVFKEMIEATNIYKSFGNLQVLKGVSIGVDEGEIVSIVGKSGAGKTTLLQILGTLMEPDRNKNSTLSIDGMSLLNLPNKELSKIRNQKIGFVFQFHRLLSEFTALENIFLPSLIAKITKKEAVAKAKELLTFLNMESKANYKPDSLSGGEQQRIAVARALINNPKVIFADEPSGNLDSVNAQELHNIFFQLRKEFNQTFVIITHNKELASKADRTILIQDGIIV